MARELSEVIRIRLLRFSSHKLDPHMEGRDIK